MKNIEKKRLAFERKQKRPSLETLEAYQEEVYNDDLFNQHIKEVSIICDVDEQVVKDILKTKFSKILKILSKRPRFYTRINIYGHMVIELYRGQVIPRKYKGKKTNTKTKNDE